MSRLAVSIALSENVRTRPILDGLVEPAGIELLPTGLHPSEMFWRQLHHRDFDVSEMSLSSLFALAGRSGVEDWIALPVFTSRKAYHVQVLVRSDAGIREPADLVGRPVGVPEYQQTAAVWTRGVLLEQFGVKATDVSWFMERDAGHSHAAATGFVPPPELDLRPVAAGETIESMLVAGSLDATLLYLRQPNLIDRSRRDLLDEGVVRPLFAPGESQRYCEATGLFPMNHAVVVRRVLAERHPWIVLNLYEALVRARQLGHARAAAAVRDMVEPGTFGSFVDGSRYAYGWESNAAELTTLSRYCHEQGITQERVDPRVLFDEKVLAF